MRDAQAFSWAHSCKQSAHDGRFDNNGTIAGTTCELAPFDNTTYGSTLTLTITGGTGRFAGATGTIAISGTSTGVAGGPFSDTSTMTGTISY